jgi:hypothetical protein
MAVYPMLSERAVGIRVPLVPTYGGIAMSNGEIRGDAG